MKNFAKFLCVGLLVSLSLLLAQGEEQGSDPCAETFIQNAEQALAVFESTGDMEKYQSDIQAAITAYQDCSGGSGNVVIFYPYLP